MKFTLKNKIDEKELRQILSLDRQTYATDRCVSFKVCNAWLKKNPEIIYAIKLNEQVVGFFSFLPLTEKAYQKILSGEINECDLRAADILPYIKNGELSCLFCDIVVEPEFRHTSAMLVLLNAYSKLLKNLAKRGIKIKRIIALCVTKEGVALAERFDFKLIKKNKTDCIYELKY